MVVENEPISGYYCPCTMGVKTLGNCGHVVNVLWYLGYARHEQGIKYPSRALFNYIEDVADRNGLNNEDLITDRSS